ncbi:MAG: ribonuclease P protein component [Candidatus Paceibacterota bacterium]|jgi:ribonuclease P protein component
MLPKKKRITKEIFQTLMKGGKTFSSRLFLFYYKNTPYPQYVFVAPKNVYKTAVKRNKQRRIGYNIIRFLSLKSGSGIFMYKKQSISSTQVEIKEDIIFILKKTGFL